MALGAHAVRVEEDVCIGLGAHAVRVEDVCIGLPSSLRAGWLASGPQFPLSE